MMKPKIKAFSLGAFLLCLNCGANAQNVHHPIFPAEPECLYSPRDRMGMIGLISVLDPGRGYPEGIYNTVLIGGTGKGAKVKVTASRHGVLSLDFIDPGQGYRVGDRLSIPGPFSSGFSFGSDFVAVVKDLAVAFCPTDQG